MPSANAKWKSHIAKHRRPASRRPRSGSPSTSAVNMRIGGSTNAVAGFVHPHSASGGRVRRAGSPL